MNEPIKNPKLVDIYCRIEEADLAQELDETLDEQEQACRKYAEEHGFAIALVHKEIASGDKYRERERLDHLRQRYQNSEIQGVLVSSLDRLSQKQVHLAILIDEMEQYGVTLDTVKETFDDTVMGKFIRTMCAFQAEYEHEKRIERMQRRNEYPGY